MSDINSSTSIGGVGLGVADLERSVAFYTSVLGMQEFMRLDLPEMREAILVFPKGGAALILMHWTDGSEPNYEANPVKVVLNVTDTHAVLEQIRAAGHTVTREPEAIPALGGAVVAMATDPDGYVIELLGPPATA